jgi:copper chaperone CopZ
MFVATYKVDGMTCGHCVNAVTSEIGNIGDVSEVQVDLAAGLVTVHSAGPLGIDAVRAAVDEAGYALAAQV